MISIKRMPVIYVLGEVKNIDFLKQNQEFN